MKQPRTIRESIYNIQVVIKLINLVKKRKLVEKMTENHIDTIIQVTLLRTDYREYMRVWSEKLRKEMRRSSTRVAGFGSSSDSDGSESGEDGSGDDLEASVAEELSCDTLERRKKFLFRYLNDKLGQLKIQVAMEARSGREEFNRYGKDDQGSKARKKKVGFERAYVIQESDSELEYERSYAVGQGKEEK